VSRFALAVAPHADVPRAERTAEAGERSGRGSADATTAGTLGSRRGQLGCARERAGGDHHERRRALGDGTTRGERECHALECDGRARCHRLAAAGRPGELTAARRAVVGLGRIVLHARDPHRRHRRGGCRRRPRAAEAAPQKNQTEHGEQQGRADDARAKARVTAHALSVHEPACDR
jgi:hypothetical protein